VFIKNPFSQTGDCLDDRLYKTGDLALQLPDGNFRFMGRVDGLVKVRGKRVELGEIEAVLNALAVIREAVVLAREDTFGEARLVAYAVLWPSARPLDSAATRSVLLETLPDHMVPSWYVTLDSLPLTRNGKIDRKALPSPDMTRGEVGYEQPQTETEQRLAIIWAEVLGLDRAGVHDDFFASGGHSLLATQVISRVRAEFQSDISVRTLFDTPTLAAFARRIEQGRQRTPCSAE